MPTQAERLASLEADRKWHWIALSAAAVLAFTWLTYITVTLNGAVGDVRAIKQSIVDGGAKGIVAQLEKPASEKQLAATLGIVASEVRLDRLSGKKPKAANLALVSSTVKQVASQNPQLPEVWQAAFQLVSYRSEALLPSSPTNLPPCPLDSDNGLMQLRNTPPAKGLFVATFFGCVLNLDDDGSFFRTKTYQFFKEANLRNPGNSNIIRLVGGIVKYSGGKIIPINDLFADACVFDFSIPAGLPPLNGRTLADQLLVADLAQAKVKFPS